MDFGRLITAMITPLDASTMKKPRKSPRTCWNTAQMDYA